MLQSMRYLRQHNILNPRHVIPVSFPRKLKPSRVLSTEECACDPTQPPPCPPPCGWVLMDDLPIPCGSWQEEFKRKNKKHNQNLIIGGGFLLITLIIVNRVGFVKGYDVSLF
ncbi:uncharacterized protein LOC107272762 [Cephus cinctus]|uniref:Uncharacterized protein LOC107272762 n=1 Tax=Cephus cinctus TaxID=211228 RepID=A0AAJ7CA37_CEPCN|nr:uncharacterized protein LOC107272762 [Cephus cinctus]